MPADLKLGYVDRRQLRKLRNHDRGFNRQHWFQVHNLRRRRSADDLESGQLAQEVWSFSRRSTSAPTT
jgi:hypothetical protein